MKAELKEKWVAALRSSEYAQTKYALCRVETYFDLSAGYCCLGVLVDVDPNAEWNDDIEHLSSCKTFRGAIGTLGFNYQAEVGLDTDHTENLMAMNDDLEKTFPEIADWIEENIPVD